MTPSSRAELIIEFRIASEEHVFARVYPSGAARMAWNAVLVER